MYTKLISTFLTIAIFATSANGQTKDSDEKSLTDPFPNISLKCPSSIMLSKNVPLLIFNDKRINYLSLEYHLFDIKNIDSVTIYNSKDEHRNMYGNAAKNGVVIIKTKDPIEWESSKEIFRTYDKNLFHSYKSILLVIDGKKIDAGKRIYFSKNIIKSVKYDSDANEFYVDKTYRRIIYITTKDISGS